MKIKQKTSRFPSGIDGAVKLALIAAPFVAAGVREEEGIRRAWKLIEAAQIRLFAMEDDEKRFKLVSVVPVGIDGAMRYVGLKANRRRLRELLLEVRGRNFVPDGEALWKRAVAGEPVFTWDILWRLKELRQKKITARNQAATAVRQKRVKEKRAMESSL